jgi:phosphate acetyltransferase
LGALQANESANYPAISGIVLTGNIVPDDSILILIEGLTSIVPIISVEGGTYNITNKIGDIKAKIYADNKQKIETSINTFEKYVDLDNLTKKLSSFEAKDDPKMFQYNLVKRAKNTESILFFQKGMTTELLLLLQLLSMDVVDITILGSKKQIENKVAELGIAFDFRK